MPNDLQSRLDHATASLRENLADNLYSCCAYGSAVRGNFIEGVSDINLLIVLNESTVAAHRAIAKALGNAPNVDPFVLGRRGFDRSVQAFAAKFASIKRNYRVLHGADPLMPLAIGSNLERFLCEQAIRNLRLRLVYAFITRERSKTYGRFLSRSVTPLFIQLGEALRLHGVTVPNDFPTRIPVFEKEFGFNTAVLRDLLDFKAQPSKLDEAQSASWHERLFPELDKVLVWVEAKWPAPGATPL